MPSRPKLLVDRVQMFGLIWGTFRTREQDRLALKYQFPAPRMTSATAGLILTAAAVEAWTLGTLGAPVGMYLSALYFALESLYRLYVSKGQEKPARSLVGWVLQRLVSPSK